MDYMALIRNDSKIGRTSLSELHRKSYKDDMAIHQAIELVALFYFDGKIDEQSGYETKQCEAVINQIKNNPTIPQRSLALCWIYLQAHSEHPLGEFIEVIRCCFIKNDFLTRFKPISAFDNDLWVFDQYHFKDAVTLLLLNHKREKNENDLEFEETDFIAI